MCDITLTKLIVYAFQNYGKISKYVAINDSIESMQLSVITVNDRRIKTQTSHFFIF